MGCGRYNALVDREQFVRRDWSAVATSKARFWHDPKAIVLRLK
jgi:hypothetical protein